MKILVRLLCALWLAIPVISIDADRSLADTRVALVIGNGHYPDANEPLTQPINDARGLTATLRHDGFDVEVVEDAGKDDMEQAIDALTRLDELDDVTTLMQSLSS